MIDFPINYRIAFIYNLLSQFQGFGGYLQRGFEKICRTIHYTPDDIYPATLDAYYYIDDGPTYYMQPKYHPASFFAIDMVVKPFWYLQPVATYFERFQNFDRCYVSNTAAQRYCQERGLFAKVIGFAADLGYHHPIDCPRDLDWIAVWHNTADRIPVTEAAIKQFPKGMWLWAGDYKYGEYINRGKCALNWLRGDIVNMRVFEVMACCRPLITTRHPDMAYFGFTEDEHYLGFDTLEEMLDKIAWVQVNQEQAEEMAKRAYELVVAKHTYYNRALEVFCGIPGG